MMSGESRAQPLPKVGFIVATLGHGRGGHFWSLKTTVEALAGRVDCFVVDIGVKPSPVVQATNARSYHIPQRGTNPVPAVRALSRILSHEQPDMLNLFDGRVDFITRASSIWCGMPMIRTKCGGPGLKYSPHHGTVIVYSKEDQQWFSAASKFSTSQIHLIPNRVLPVTCDPDRLMQLRARLSSDKPVFLRISRFSTHYEKSMVQAISLVKRLNTDGHPSQLLIIGAIESAEVHARIQRLIDDNVTLVTEDMFTMDAKELIDVGDFIIGTGRGFMEAASRGKVMLTPLQEGRYPFLLTEETFEQVFSTNFSPRNQVVGYDEEANYGSIAHLLETPEARKRSGALASTWFEQYFNVVNTVDRYVSIFATRGQRPRLNPLDLALSWYTFRRSFRGANAEPSTTGSLR